MIELFPDWVQSCKYTKLNGASEVQKALDSFDPNGYFALDTETTGLDRLSARILGFSFSEREGQAFWVPVNLDMEPLQVLAEFVKFRTCLFYNANYDIPILERHGVKINKFEDVMCLVFMQNPNARMRGLKDASLEILDLEMVELKKLFPGKKVQIRFDALNHQVQTIYACMDADVTGRLFKELSNLKTAQSKIWGLEMALIRPNLEMELNGVDLDIAMLKGLSETLDSRMTSLKRDIFQMAGGPFELNSPAQVGDILYNKLGLKCRRFTKKGAPSTDKDSLALLEREHNIVPMLMEIGSLETKKNSFVDKLPTLLNPVTNRLHCSFIQWNVPTGRYSSSGPNLQNVPKASQEEINAGFNIRDAFVANSTLEANLDPQDDDWTFLDCDYSQIELRVAASMSKEPVWCEAYKGNIDVHQDTAKKIFKIERPSKDQRGKAKTGNFGVLYGQSGYSFAMKMGLPVEEGEEFVRAWFAALPVLADWMAVQKARSRRSEYAHTFWGRRRPMSIGSENGINCADRKLRQFWERSVISHIVQGSAADIMKLSIVLLRKKIREAGLQDDIKMLLTVHDQILFKVRMRKVEEAKPLIKETMELKIDGWVPIKIGMEEGTRWGSCKEVGQKA